MKVILYTFSLLIIFGIGGCEYQPHEVFVRNVKQDVPVPELTVNFNLDSDTVYVYGNSTIRFNVSSEKNRIAAVKFYINHNQVTNVDYDNNGGYSFTLFEIKPGDVYTLNVEVFTNKGSGSIADNIGAENFIFQSKEWTIIYLSDRPVMTSEIFEDKLKLTWTAIKSPGIHKYYLYKSVGNEVLKDSTTNNWYIDENYIGEPANYGVFADDIELTLYSASLNVSYYTPKLIIDNSDRFRLRWNRSPFYKNIAGYKITTDLTNEIAFIKDPDSTWFDFQNGIYGQNYLFTLTVIPKIITEVYDAQLNYMQSSVITNYGINMVPSIGSGASCFPLKGNSFYIYYGYPDSRLCRFSTDEKIVTSSAIDTIMEMYSVSPAGTYFCYLDVFQAEKISLLNGENLQAIKTIQVSSFLNHPIYSKFPVSDIGTAAIDEGFNKNLLICDLNNETILDSIPYEFFIRDCKISSNGKYLFVKDKKFCLYRIDNIPATNIWKSATDELYEYSYYEFYPDNTDRMVVFDGANLITKNCSDFSDVSSFPVDASFIVNVDFSKDKVLAYKDNNFIIYSLTDGHFIRQIPTVHNGTYSHLFNDYIFSNYGFQYNIND